MSNFFEDSDKAMEMEYFPESISDEPDGGVSHFEARQIIRSLRERVNQTPNLAAAAIKAEQERIVRETMEYHHGCPQGKVEFLDSIGLGEFCPRRTARVTVDVVVPFSYQDGLVALSDEIRDDIANYTGCVEGVSVVDREWVEE